MMTKGRLFGLGVGPGDPELMTVKAVRLLQQVPIVAYLAAKGKKGNALSIVETYLRPEQQTIALIYPVTTEHLPPHLDYETLVSTFYDQSANDIAAYLDNGHDVAVICEGDPFFYGSFMYIHDRLATRYETEVIPGVCSVLAAASILGAPLVRRNQSLGILSGVLPEEELKRRLADLEAAAIMKLGTHFDKVRRVIIELGLADRACYIERATMHNQKIIPLLEVNSESAPYFSIVLGPGKKWQS